MIDFLPAGAAEAIEKPKSLYVHIPFCVSKCAYCDFHSFPKSNYSESVRQEYIEKTLRRVDRLCKVLSLESFDTIYIGGGTPTSLEDSAFETLLKGFDARFGAKCREWTIEANPESLTMRKIELIELYHVNRISLGIQSMDGAELRRMGRAGGVADNRGAMEALRPLIDAGLSFSADLIAAYPEYPSSPGHGGYPSMTGQSEGAEKRFVLLKEAIDYLAANGANHISLYDLTLEEGTPLMKAVDTGILSPEDEDEAYAVRKRSELLLERLGYKRYEVSNFARAGAESLHNGTYWAMKSYLGVGSGAVSTLNIRPDATQFYASDIYSLRIEEGKDLARYLADPEAPASIVPLGRKDSAFEMVMMGLRTTAGLDKNRFKERFGVSFEDVFHRSIEKWAGHFIADEASIHLDDEGLDILNRILVDMLAEMDQTQPDKSQAECQ